MVPRRVFAMLPLLICAPADAETLPTETSRLRVWSDDQYARLVLGARQLGRRYSDADVVSGARRHYEEVRAQYCDGSAAAVVPGIPADCDGPARLIP